MVEIGVVWPEKGDLFWEGIGLAEAEMVPNVELKKLFDPGTLQDAKMQAQELSDDRDVIAVIGHRDAEAARVVSVLYEYTDVVMIAPASTSPQLTRDGFQRIFRMLPSDDQIGAALAEHASSAGWHQLLVIYSNDAYGRAIANAFESRGETLGLRITERVAFDPGGEPAMSSVDKSRIDAVLLAGHTEAKLDLGKPVISPSAFELASVSEAFTSSFTSKYGHAPDRWAVQGYVALKLVSDAIDRAKSRDPDRVSKILRGEEWQTAIGPLRFRANGAAVGPKMDFL
jgi:branched-chain amino acid transport system substrate-binding protein